MFIRNSFGFRPKKGAHDAIKASYLSLKDNKRPFVVEIDLASFFDTLSHRRLIKFLEKRITDPRILSLISRFLTAGVLEQDGNLKISETGTPQGSIMSPVLANVFLHYILDSWFLANYANQGGIIIRYADDAIFLFELRHEAESFRSQLKIHLNEFGLKLNEDKSGMIHFEKRQPKEVFHFLGFTFFWSKDYASTRRVLRVKTAKTTLVKKIQEFQDWIRENRGRKKLDELWRLAAAKLRGHYNYYGLCTNRPKLNHFYYAVTGSLFKWLNRRSQRKSFNWETFGRRLTHFPLPVPPAVSALVQLDNRRYYA
jgi:group II intron reverse transcriptase/maturase